MSFTGKGNSIDWDCNFRWPGIKIDGLRECLKEKHEIEGFNPELSIAATEFIKKNAARERYARLHDADLRCLKDRIAFLAPPSSGKGYLMYSDKLYWDYVYDLRNILIDEVDEKGYDSVNTLLLNMAAKQPYSVEITRNPMYHVDESQYDIEAMHAARKVYSEAFWLSRTNVDPELLHIRNKKNSSMGFPYETLDGSPVKSEDISYFRDVDSDKPTRWYKDWSGPKSTWRDPQGSPLILQRQLDFTGDVTPSNIGTLIENNIVSVHNGALRENCPDAPIMDDPGRQLSQSDLIVSKDRRYTFFTPTFEQVLKSNGFKQTDGILDNAKINTTIRASGNPALQFGFANRERKIYPSNNSMHSNGTILANSCLYEVEHSCKGNPSTNPDVIADWNNAAAIMKDKGYDGEIVHGDCTNAEVTVSENFKLLLELVPEEIVHYLEMTSWSVIPTNDWFRVLDHAYCSAVWYTTWMHVIKGNFELTRLTRKYLEMRGVDVFSQVEVTTRQLSLLLYGDKRKDLLIERFGEDYDPVANIIKIGPDAWVNPKLGTDDMVAQLFFKPKRDLDLKALQDYFDKSMLGVDIGETVQFGMHETLDLLEENLESRLAKLNNSEHMGFTYKDGMSFYVKARSSGHEGAIDHCLRKHFGVGLDDYSVYVDLFAMYLRDIGGDPLEYLNAEYSPSAKLLVGKLIDHALGNAVPIGEYRFDAVTRSEEYMKHSAAVDPEYTRNVMEIFESHFEKQRQSRLEK